MIKAILFDLDNTLLDFNKGEYDALKVIYNDLNIPYNEDTINLFIKHSNYCWRELEKNNMNLKECRCNRWIYFLNELNIKDIDIDKIVDKFSIELSKGHYLMDNALLTLTRLSKKYKIYIITNGVSFIQHRRIKESKIEDFIDGIYISEEIGHYKPNKEYFDYVLNDIGLSNKEVIVVGDSLTSDILGANNSNIDSILLDNNDNFKDYRGKRVTNLLGIFNYL